MNDNDNVEFAYLKRCNERDIAKILQLDLESIAIRHELEHKRRGFMLLAELAVTLSQGGDYDSVFVTASRRINAALNMQRTVVLMPAVSGEFKPAVLRGYSAVDEETISAKSIQVDGELLDPNHPVLINSVDTEDRLASLRRALDLPYFVSSPIILNNEVAAILITGRTVEQTPFLTRLTQHDLETVQAISSLLAAMLAGRRLADAEERTQIMLDAMPMCCTFWDGNGKHIDCNEAAPKLFGFSEKQEYLERFCELSPKYQLNGRLSSELVVERVGKAFTEGYVRFEWMHQKPDGEPVPAEIILVRVRRGNSYIVVGYTRDLRLQKAMHAEVAESQRELLIAREKAEKNARAKSEFLANMSHEIRTPMNAILGMAHLLNGTELTVKQREYVNKVTHSSKLLLQIINDILDYSNLDSGRIVFERKEFSFRKLLQNALDILRVQIEGKPIVLQADIEPDVSDMFVGDPMRLEQILHNLVNNAIKFTPVGNVSVKVTQKIAEAGNSRLFFTVSDTGIGMDKEQVDNLFMPFMQADASATRKYGGMGLGLAICYSLVQLMSGEIRCESMPGKGSSFIFSVLLGVPGAAAPEQASDSSGAVAEKDKDASDSLSGMRVLLVEDNDINQTIAAELLENQGVVVTVAANGVEGLEELASSDFDLVLMDIQMPEMDGLTATRKIRENPRYATLPVVAMTAHALDSDREASLEAGMDDHITKPIDPRILYDVLRRFDRQGKQK